MRRLKQCGAGKEHAKTDYYYYCCCCCCCCCYLALACGGAWQVPGLNLVINYDAPSHYEDYVHRVGRTGRAGNKGTAYTFVSPTQRDIIPDMVRALTSSGRPVPKDLRAIANSIKEEKKKGNKVRTRVCVRAYTKPCCARRNASCQRGTRARVPSQRV